MNRGDFPIEEVIWNDTFCRILAKEDCRVIATIL